MVTINSTRSLVPFTEYGRARVSTLRCSSVGRCPTTCLTSAVFSACGSAAPSSRWPSSSSSSWTSPCSPSSSGAAATGAASARSPSSRTSPRESMAAAVTLDYRRRRGERSRRRDLAGEARFFRRRRDTRLAMISRSTWATETPYTRWEMCRNCVGTPLVAYHVVSVASLATATCSDGTERNPHARGDYIYT